MICLLLDGSRRCQIIPDCEPDVFITKENFSRLLHYEDTRIKFYEEALKKSELSFSSGRLLVADLGEKINDIYQNFKVIDEDL